MPDRSALIGRLSRGERIVVLAGAIAVLIAGVNIARPSLARLELREEKIAQRRDALASMRNVGAPVTPRTAGPRALGGRTPEEAAVELRTLLQGYADASRISVSRLDVTSMPQNPGTTGAVPMVPAALSGVGDIRGIAELLRAIGRGPRALEVTALSIARDSVRGDGPLRLTLAVRGPWIARQ